ETDAEIPVNKEDRFTFPSGAEAGTLLHQLFEELHFQDSETISPIIKEQLEISGLDEKWEPVLSEWISHTLDHILISPKLRLSNLPETDLLKEMEFHFPVNALNAKNLWDLIREKAPDNAE